MIRTQENGIYSGKKLHGKGVFAAELFAFWGKKPIRAHKKTKKHRVRPASTAGKPVKTGRHCSDTARKPKKTAKNCPEPEKPAPKGGGAAMSSRSTGRQVYFKFVGSDTAHADRPRHGSDHGRRRGRSPTRKAELILHGCPKKGGKASARKPIPAIKTVAQADDRGVRKSAGGLRVCRPGGCWQRAGPPTGRTRK